MAVIGNSPNPNDISVFKTVNKQSITGTGDSSYNLSYDVSVPEELEVFVNNVRQEPRVAYNIGAGQITFDEGIDSTDDCYIIFQGSRVGTVAHPANQALTATTVNAALAQTGSDSNDIAGNLTLSGTHSELKLVDGNIVFYDGAQNAENVGGEVTLTTGKFRDKRYNRIIMDGEHDSSPGTGPNKITFYETGSWVGGFGLHAGVVGHYTGQDTNFYKLTSDDDSAGASILHMQIDTNGRVLKPKQPHIFGSPVNSGGSGVANRFDIGSYSRGTLSFSNNRITVPIAGLYLITYMTICDSQTARVDTHVKINGTNVQAGLTNTNGSGYQQRTHTLVVNLSANDYIEFSNNDWYNSAGTAFEVWRTASVTLIG
jgi:hypothetical protein